LGQDLADEDHVEDLACQTDQEEKDLLVVVAVGVGEDSGEVALHLRLKRGKMEKIRH